ncbi:NUDIX hydrolase [Virgisporangium aliadipatigenens]|uniref:NUDIX hydrolase n=1 Tax=Virgisporangium aliadipatigenens TaxID=741659 RepID=A0A8J4DQ99_9ACTN|nr:NUDIX domain-containing protein [Virgisporangium aliadipatigenens]GIJ45731.1 NUDIX hydrolase [Virgisporangium aliadipatigenens]
MIVQAAGGIVWRDGPEILVVHRPRYDDWSLPKGKLEPGEHPLAAAVREVEEETGVRGVPQVRMPSIRYLTGEPGVEKVVDFWTMRVLRETPREADDEITDVVWLPAQEARERLTYTHDRGLVTAFTTLPVVASVVVLVRHAYAGKRKEWRGPDDERPLQGRGIKDAERVWRLLPLFAPDSVLSAPAKRCRDTVAGIGLPVRVDGRFAEDGNVEEAAAALREYAAANASTVVCSQGGLMRPLLPRLRAETGVAPGTRVSSPKGSAWVLSYDADQKLVAADPLDPRQP